MTGVKVATRKTVIERDDFMCQRCGKNVGWDYSLQHRRPRASGGSKLEHINQPPNLVLLCGSATTGCHGWVESHRNDARENGWSVTLLGRYLPEDVPWLGRGPTGTPSWFFSTGDNKYVAPEDEAIAHMVELGIRQNLSEQPF